MRSGPLTQRSKAPRGGVARGERRHRPWSAGLLRWPPSRPPRSSPLPRPRSRAVWWRSASWPSTPCAGRQLLARPRARRDIGRPEPSSSPPAAGTRRPAPPRTGRADLTRRLPTWSLRVARTARRPDRHRRPPPTPPHRRPTRMGPRRRGRRTPPARPPRRRHRVRQPRPRLRTPATVMVTATTVAVAVAVVVGTATATVTGRAMVTARDPATGATATGATATATVTDTVTDPSTLTRSGGRRPSVAPTTQTQPPVVLPRSAPGDHHGGARLSHRPGEPRTRIASRAAG